jgi:hypothetical protein
MQIEVVIFGGANEAANNNVNLIAGHQSNRIKVTFGTSTTPPTYSFGAGWITEEMGISRVMGDATLLPNGDVILLNGAQVCASIPGRLHSAAFANALHVLTEGPGWRRCSWWRCTCVVPQLLGAALPA